MYQRQSSSRDSGISMVWDPQSLNIMTAHEPAVVIISRFWHLHGVGPSVYEHHAEQTSGLIFEFGTVENERHCSDRKDRMTMQNSKRRKT
ncbi:hypothetical protein DPMN_132203 [Dreissena polymorpha]|uniref:Uncharacterized protein n=1 Tax=Dreissena polymorpha TaxID=45954 RepID=A0A9D4J8N5_DREPO|nr:hypothetical protein DPMN_132203 [Dreissena polymorpha]